MTPAPVFRGFLERIRRNEPVAVLTVVRGDGIGRKLLVDRSGTEGSLGSQALDRAASAEALERIAVGRSDTVEIEGRQVFIEVRVPPPRLVIVGAVHIASALARFARELGFRVIVSDARGRFATPERFPDVDELHLGWPNEILPKLALDEFSYVVVITHDAKLDNPALLAALKSPAPYIGALGSTRTHARRVKALKEAGATDAEIARIHAPIGLEIGARTPEEIALATMAQIVAVRNAAGDRAATGAGDATGDAAARGGPRAGSKGVEPGRRGGRS